VENKKISGKYTTRIKKLIKKIRGRSS